jgi:aminoglycoside/choline kinase family phosphotransferase
MQGMTIQRTQDLQNWAAQHLQVPLLSFVPLAGDASFRRYFRLTLAEKTLVAMDAPPEQEDSHSFVQVARAFADAGLLVPELLAYDLQQGFLLLSDLGDQLYLPLLNAQSADLLYQKAITELFKIQQCLLPHAPSYSTELLAREMQIGKEWFLQKHLGLQLTAEEEQLLQTTFNLLIESALAQPQVSIHRDYHSRNLMLLKNQQLGILDFQDAVTGAITYDLVSLLRDCYIAWPRHQVEQWALTYQQRALTLGLLTENNPQQFLRWFDWMGLQRHLKCLGIFARKFHRDHTTAYLSDLPRVLQYIIDTSQRYLELASFHQFIQQRVLSVFQMRSISA